MTTTHAPAPLPPRPVDAPMPPSFPPQQAIARPFLADDDDHDSWRTSTAPAAVSMALLTGLGVGVILGLRGLVDLVGSFLVAG